MYVYIYIYDVHAYIAYIQTHVNHIAYIHITNINKYTTLHDIHKLITHIQTLHTLNPYKQTRTHAYIDTFMHAMHTFIAHT